MFKFNVDNFRGFQDETFDFGRVNILIGENSGGKSSLIKVILALKQTLEMPDVSNLILSGSLTDLGTFREAIRNHNENETLSFSFTFLDELSAFMHYFFIRDLSYDDQRRKKINAYIKKALKYETNVTYKIDKKLDTHESIITTFKNEYLGSLEIVFNKTNGFPKEYYEAIGEIPTCTLVYNSKTRNKKYIYEEIEYDKRGFLSIIESSSLKKVCKKKYKSEKMFFELAVFLLTQNLIEYHIYKLTYLNPLSSKPERIYLKRDSQSQYKRSDLEKFTSLITKQQISKKRILQFSQILQEYGIADNFQILSPKNIPVSELRIMIKDLVSNISDVGYGVALQIPLLFETFMAENEQGKTFLIEQPEVHLHPKLQAKLIKTLLSMGQQNSYIIETHSEYMIRMLQVLVKNKSFNISNEDVRIFYFSRGMDKFNITKHNLNEHGRMMVDIPSGFFDNSYNLTKSLIF